MTNDNFFGEARQLFQHRVGATGVLEASPASTREFDAIVEVRTRFEQLEYLLRQIAELEAMRLPIDASSAHN